MGFREVPVGEVDELISAGAQVIDVRDLDEWTESSVPGARHIPLAELCDRLDELDQGRTAALLCRSGRRSELAAEILSARGFDDVVNLAGGMLELDAHRGADR